MSGVVLVSGPPGCGKTSWILSRLQEHRGPRAYRRLDGVDPEGHPLALDGGLDQAFLHDQIPGLHELAGGSQDPAADGEGLLAFIELPLFQPEIPQRLAFGLRPDRHLHFGRDSELPRQDTLEFGALASWSLDLAQEVWDPASLNSFWFELVNGAYGDVYRAKALVNPPDGRGFLFNWMVSCSGTQFLPLQSVASSYGRPMRLSRLVVQGKDLDTAGLQSTIVDCLLSDAVLELQQAPRRPQGEPLPATG
ncbi:ATPase [Synechococcus sp. BA-120 BA3]|nr:ATPase [Synechococcus sp. BA-120 BA3]